MRLLVALDTREGGEDALELARVLCAGGVDGVLAVSVLPVGPLPMEYELLTSEEREVETEAAFAQARAMLTGVDVETRAYGGGSPAAIISKLAETEHFDAIVIGSPHRGPVGRVMIGSVASSLLSGAPTAVAMAPRGYGHRVHDPLRLVAVGIDGSDESMSALARAEQIAIRVGATLKLVVVVSRMDSSPAAQAEQILREASDSLDPHTTWSTASRDGDPAVELVRMCEEEQVDLLVLGSRRYGPLARVLLGSVSRKVVRRSGCPVMVLRRP